jgi:signal transduction histidine kinase/DNA-binding response OmpR family regulator/ligand-binding sensor domain-containing protein
MNIRRALIAGAVLLQVTAAGQTSTPRSPSAAPAARHPEAGGLLIRQYPPEVYKGPGQNWALLQDSRGVIYVGSSGAVLEYDGVTWRRILTKSRTTIRSLAADESGRIFVGGIGDLGYLDTDAKGETQFVSLVDKLPADSQVFEDVWRTFAAPEGVYFQTQIGIFRWANGTMRIWKPTGRIFNRAQFVNNTLYVGQTGGGLMALHGDALVPVPGAERMGEEAYPIILPFDGNRLLMGTRFDGLFLYDGTVLRPFATEVDPIIKASNLYRGFVLPGDSILLTTTADGAVIIDRQGRQLERIGERDGLASPSVYYAMPDREGGLWLALGVGLARVEAQSPFSLFGVEQGLRAGGADVIRHAGTLYIAHGQGVQYLSPAASGPPKLVTISGVANQCWAFFEFTDPDGKSKPQLLLAASDGLYLIDGGTARPIVESRNRSFVTFTFGQSRVDPHRVWLGLADGLASIRWVNGRWVNEGRVDGITEQVRSLYQAGDGTLWAGTSTAGLLRLRSADSRPGGERPPSPAIDRYGAAQGLAPGGATVVAVADKMYVSVLGKVAVFDEASGQFVPDRTFEVVTRNPDTDLLSFKEGPDGRVYVSSGTEGAVLTRQADGNFATDRQLFSRFSADQTAALYPEKDGVLWFGTSGRIVRFDTRQFVRTSPPFTALVRRVTVNQAETLAPIHAEGTPPRLPATSRSVRFEFAAPSFLNERATRYQSRLDGLDADWSAWSEESRRDYTNLGFGDYRFRVRATNELSQVSNEGVYAFTILPPWYRTWWAYALYVAMLGLAIFGVDRAQRRRLIGKERQRAEVAEAKLRAESAEALAQAERDRNRQIEQLSDIGREITASLEFDTIFDKLYQRVNQLADADVFGVGLYHPERQEIEYRLAIEQGKRYAPYTRTTTDRNQFAVWCVEQAQPVFINDVATEYRRYIEHHDTKTSQLEDGSMSRSPQSLIYLPLVSKGHVLGVFSIQSFEKNAYTEQHLHMMQNLAAFTAIALDNASAYRQINEQEHENRRLAEEALRARAAAEEADAAKSAFLSTVSHELRTPLTSVLGFAKIIKKRLDERIFPLIHSDDRKVTQTIQQVEDNLRVVVSEGERLTKLIDDVLDLAKIEAGKLEWHMAPVAIGDIIERATAATASLFEQKGLQLVKAVEPGIPTLTGDPDRLIQVVINLISNAVKFTDAGSVTCRASRDGGTIVVSVTDTGMGIAPEDQPKVFERFKQVGDTLTDKPKGTGLGLPICKEIVEHHGGHIWVSSVLGQGSTFSFSLPVTDAAQQSLPLDLATLVRQLRDQVVVTTPRTNEHQPRLLVVDDEANIRDLLTQELSEAGYTVTTASNGRDALARIRRQRPDLVILDVMMPEMNGFDVAAVLRNDPATLDIPIIILSIVQDRERGFRIGVDRYLTKPIDTNVLFKEIGTLLDQRKSHKRVLVVDDDASAVKMLTDVLKSRGYSVTEAREGDLFERAKSLQPDIIMLNSSHPQPEIVQTLRFEKGLENVLFLVYR